MKLNKLFIGLFGMLALTVASCSSDDDYQRASVSGEQVYFPNTLGNVIETSPDESSFTVPVYRVNTVGELTVPLTITMAPGSIYTPQAQQVTFADGSSQASLTFTYDPADIVYGDYYDISIAISGDELLSDYGVSTYNFQAGKTAWVDMDGVAIYREDVITALFGVDNPVYEVDIQENVVTPGVYRIINPYGEAYEYNEPGDWDDSKDYYVTVNATDPDHVYVERSEMGVDWGYGMMSVQSLATYYMAQGKTVQELIASNPEYFGTLENGVITMPAGSLLFSMADYNDGAWYRGNGSGLFAIALPGAKIADYSIEFTYLGRLTDADDNDFIRGRFKLGKDIYSVKYAVVSAKDDVDAAVDGIVDGTIESGELKRSENEPIEAPISGESGKYNLVVVAFDANGAAVSSEAFTIRYTSSSDTGVETWTPIYAGTYKYAVAQLSSGEPFYSGSDEVTLYRSDKDGSRYKVLPWAEWTADSTEGGLIFTLDDEGNVEVDQVETGYVDEEWGTVWATDILTYGASDKYVSGYENNVFTFYLAYHDYDGAWAYQVDQLELTGAPSAPRRAASTGGRQVVRSQSRSFKTVRLDAEPVR